MMMKPKEKNKLYVAGIHQGVELLDENEQRRVMTGAGKRCSVDLLALLESVSGNKIESVELLVETWNSLRQQRKLQGLWEIKGDSISGIFPECSCPLVMSGLIELHPVQCYCSEAMLTEIFSKMEKRKISVEMKRTIGRGDDACEFKITKTGGLG